jgi:hypothetical protein
MLIFTVILDVVIVNVTMLSVVLLNVAMLNVLTLTVVVPIWSLLCKKFTAVINPLSLKASVCTASHFHPSLILSK